MIIPLILYQKFPLSVFHIWYSATHVEIQSSYMGPIIIIPNSPNWLPGAATPELGNPSKRRFLFEETVNKYQNDFIVALRAQSLFVA